MGLKAEFESKFETSQKKFFFHFSQVLFNHYIFSKMQKWLQSSPVSRFCRIPGICGQYPGYLCGMKGKERCMAPDCRGTR